MVEDEDVAWAVAITRMCRVLQPAIWARDLRHARREDEHIFAMRLDRQHCSPPSSGLGSRSAPRLWPATQGCRVLVGADFMIERNLPTPCRSPTEHVWFPLLRQPKHIINKPACWATWPSIAVWRRTSDRKRSVSPTRSWWGHSQPRAGLVVISIILHLRHAGSEDERPQLLSSLSTVSHLGRKLVAVSGH